MATETIIEFSTSRPSPGITERRGSDGSYVRWNDEHWQAVAVRAGIQNAVHVQPTGSQES